MDISIWLVLAATVVQFIIGAMWYSPLMFGKWWMQIMEMSHVSKAELQAMEKSMIPFYGLQFVLTLFSTLALANGMAYFVGLSIYNVVIWLWLGFLVPTTISSIIWGRTQKKYWLQQTGIMLSMQIVCLMVAAYILTI